LKPAKFCYHRPESIEGAVALLADLGELVGLTMNLAAGLGSHGINVNAIAPGMILDEAGLRALPNGEMRTAIQGAIPLKTHIEGPPEDLVGTLVLLVSDAGVWITGQTISVDGGWIMRY